MSTVTSRTTTLLTRPQLPVPSSRRALFAVLGGALGALGAGCTWQPEAAIGRVRAARQPAPRPQAVEPGDGAIICSEFTADGIASCLAQVVDGGEVYLPAGTYTIDRIVIVPRGNVTIHGAGDATILQATSSDFNLLYLGDRSGVTIGELVFRGAGQDGAGGGGIVGDRIRDSRFRNLRFERCGSSDATALLLQESSGNQITGCTFDSNGRGIQLYRNCTNNVIDSCTGRANAKEVVFLNEGCTDNVISNCVSDNDGSRAPAVSIAMRYSHRSALLNCTVRRSGREQGVELAAGDDYLVSGCTIADSHWSGLHVINSQRAVIVGNTITGNFESGVLLRSGGAPEESRSCDGCLIAGNVIAGNNPSGQTLPDKTWAGVEIQNGSNVRVLGNRLRDNHSAGIYVGSGNSGTVVRANQFEGAHLSALVDHGTGTVADHAA